MGIRSLVSASSLAIATLLGLTLPLAAQSVAEDYVPAPAFGGAPTNTPYTNAPELLNRDEVARVLARNYPAALRQRGEGGNVFVWILVDERGDVMSARVRGPSGKPALDASALRVTSSMRFKPGLKDGAPVKVWIALPVFFHAPDQPPAARADASDERPRVNRWGTPPPLPTTTPPPSLPSFAPSLLNNAYVMRLLREAFDGRFQGTDTRGTTTLKLRVNIAGDAASAEIARSSGNPALDSLVLSLKDSLVFVPAIRSGRYSDGTAELSIRFPPREEK